MNFHRWQFKLVGDIGVFNRLCFVQRFPFYPFGNQRAGGNGGTAAVSLETRVFNDTLIVDFDLQLHHVATGRCADHAATHVLVAVVKRAHVTWILVVIDNFFAVSHVEFSLLVPN